MNTFVPVAKSDANARDADVAERGAGKRKAAWLSRNKLFEQENALRIKVLDLGRLLEVDINEDGTKASNNGRNRRIRD